MSETALFDQFFALVEDPTAADLAELDGQTMYRLLRLHPPTDVARFGRDMSIPVGRRALTDRDAERMLSNLRFRDQDRRVHAAGWLTYDLVHPLFHALLGEIDVEWHAGAACADDMSLAEMVAEWGLPVLRLALAGARRQRQLADVVVAAAVTEGSLIPDSWEDAAMEVADEAEELARRRVESIEARRAERAYDGDADDDPGDEEPSADIDPDDAGHGPGGGVSDSPDSGDVADSQSDAAAANPTGDSGNDGGWVEAMAALAAAVAAAQAALADQLGRDRGLLGRMESLRLLDPARMGAPVDDQLAEVVALAAAVDPDSDEGRFLTALGELIDLPDPAGRAAAGMQLLGDPVGSRFAPLLMAATGGALSIPQVVGDTDELGRWLEIVRSEPFDAVIAAWSTHPGPTGTSAADDFDTRGNDPADTGARGPVGDLPGVPGRPVPKPAAGVDDGPGDGDSTAGGPFGGETADQAPTDTDDPDADSPTDAGEVGEPDQTGETDTNLVGTGPAATTPPSAPAANLEGDAQASPTDTATSASTADGISADRDDDHEPGDGNLDHDHEDDEPYDEETDTEMAAPEPAAPDSGELAAWAHIFAEGRWGLGSHLGRATNRPGRARALEAVAVIDAARSGTGLAANALYDQVAALSPVEIGGDEAMQLVALAAAIRACLVAPFSTATGPLEYLRTIFESTTPNLSALAGAALDSAAGGLAVADTVAAPSSAEERTRRAEEAAEWLARPRHTSFDRANRIWSNLTAPGGLVHTLVGPAADDDASAALAVRAALADATPNRIDAELRAQDNQIRRLNAKRLEGGARATLLRWCDEAVRLSAAWLRTVDAGRRTVTDARQDSVISRLRAGFGSHRRAALDELERLAHSDDAEMAGAAVGARRLIEGSLDLVDGTALAGPELSPDLAATADLLRTGIALGADGGPLDPMGVTTEAASDASSSWTDAFERRAGIDDHVGTATVIDLVAMTDPAEADRLRARRDDLLAATTERVDRYRREMQAALEAGRRNGQVDETDAAELEALLLAAARPGRLDLGVVTAELDRVAAGLAAATANARAAFAARLDLLRTERPEVAAQVFTTAASLAEQGDLATAEEILISGLEGAEPVTEHRPLVDFAEFFPATVDAIADGITPALVQAVTARQASAGPLDFSHLSADAAAVTAGALERWRQVGRGDQRGNLRQDLSPALRLLGIGCASDRTAPNLPRSGERQWLDLIGVDRTGQKLVPAFGSGAGTEQRLLLVWRQPPPATLVSYLDQDPSDRAVIVLYFGTMPAGARRELAYSLRRRHAKPVVVVDDAVLAWAAAKATGTFEVTMRATLPFSAVNPYQTGHGGSVPEEMFYGRVAERQAVMAEVGTNLIYGGRRLGKSALLLEAGRRFEETPDQMAVYVDLDPASIRTTRRADGLWDLVARNLTARNVATIRSGRRRQTNQELVTTSVRAWLDARPGRRMLLLLDECDAFFDADGANNFAVTRTLKEMMERDRRFKVVFAGLHQVQRFATIPNQPFAHLGKSVPIGPLSPRYGYTLLAKPLLALGWELSPELAARILAYTNYLAILLQEVGHALVSALQKRSLDGPLPQRITAEDVEAVLASESLARAIRDRFTLTLNLDPRYTIIALVLAIDALDEGVEKSVSGRDLRARCREYWPAGFADVREDEFRGLLEELVGLGILAHAGPGSFRMRSPNVLRLLGSREEIEDKLLEVADSAVSPAAFAAGDTHRVLDPATRKRSPLTEAQMADVIGRGENQLRVVVGTEAVGVDDVAEALATTERDTGTFTLKVANKPAAYTRFLEDVPERCHYLVLSDLRTVSDEALRKALAGAMSRLPMAAGASRAVVAVIGPQQLTTVEEVLPADAFDGIVALGRYSEAALRTWALDAEGGFSDTASLRELAAVTGGWPVLLDRVAESGRSRGAARALNALAGELAADPSILLGPLGLEGPDGLSPVWAAVTDLLAGGVGDAETVAELLEVPGWGSATAVRAGLAAGLLDETAEGTLSAEATVTRCWARKTGQQLGSGPLGLR